MTTVGQAVIGAIVQNRLFPYPIPPTVRTRTLGFDWEQWIKSTTTLADNGTYLVPEGIRVTKFISNDAANCTLQVYDPTTTSWLNMTTGTSEWVDLLSNGSNVRVANIGAGAARTFMLIGLRKKAGRI